MGRLLISISFVAVLLMSANALAAYVTVPVVNFSFEQPGTGKIKGWDNVGADIPGWSSDVNAFDSGVESDWPGYTEGTWSGFLLGGMSPWGSTYPEPPVWNQTDYVIKAGDQFMLSVDARDNWSEITPAKLQMTLYYVDPNGLRQPIATKIVPLDGSQGTPAVNLRDPNDTSWRKYNLNVTDVPPEAVDHLLGIELANIPDPSRDPPGNTWIGLDNVRIPEPATIALLGLGGLLLRKRR